MNSKWKQHGMAILFVGVLFSALVVATGCKKEPEPTAPPAPSAVALTLPEQTICPVMGKPIDKNVYTEYKGKKVYFCCPACKGKFEAEPEKYVAKLPQFKS